MISVAEGPASYALHGTLHQLAASCMRGEFLFIARPHALDEYCTCSEVLTFSRSADCDLISKRCAVAVDGCFDTAMVAHMGFPS